MTGDEQLVLPVPVDWFIQKNSRKMSLHDKWKASDTWDPKDLKQSQSSQKLLDEVFFQLRYSLSNGRQFQYFKEVQHIEMEIFQCETMKFRNFGFFIGSLLTLVRKKTQLEIQAHLKYISLMPLHHYLFSIFRGYTNYGCVKIIFATYEMC